MYPVLIFKPHNGHVVGKERVALVQAQLHLGNCPSVVPAWQNKGRGRWTGRTIEAQSLQHHVLLMEALTFAFLFPSSSHRCSIFNITSCYFLNLPMTLFLHFIKKNSAISVAFIFVSVPKIEPAPCICQSRSVPLSPSHRLPILYYITKI